MSDPYHSLRRYYIDRFHARHTATTPLGVRVLDVGGHRARIRGQFRFGELDASRTVVNIALSAEPDVLADAHKLPFLDATWDAVVCAEILEHVAEPATALSEIARVLRPGGRLYACAPFLYPIHGDPLDYGRFTPTWWRRRLDTAGLDIVTLEAQGAFWSVLTDLLRAYATEGLARADVRSRIARTTLLRALPTIKRIAVRWDTRAAANRDAFGERFSTGYGVVAVRR